MKWLLVMLLGACSTPTVAGFEFALLQLSFDEGTR